jgi:hypothetical protein
MSLITDIQKWKEDLEELAVEKAKAEGRLEQGMEELKRKGFNSVKEAKEKFDALLKRKAEAEAEAALKLEAFKKKYESFIEIN